MKKLLFATALLTALFLSACGSQKADSNDLANQPATRPEEGAKLDPEFSVDDEDTGETAEPQPDAELSEMVDAIYDVQPVDLDRKSTRLNSSHDRQSRMPSSA